VDRNFGMPLANIPPKPGAAPVGGGGGADDGVSALPALFALAREFGTGGLNPPPGTGGAPPRGAALILEGFPNRQRHFFIDIEYQQSEHFGRWFVLS
jgi:hypothetical protein